jgi:hypothetical protein
MSTRLRIGRRLSLPGALVALAVSAGPALAQGTSLDPRWEAWLGCWQPVDSASTTIGIPSTRAVCVTPDARKSGIEVATIADGAIADRHFVDATGAQVPFTREGCNGWESGRWSADGRRVYLRSEYACQDGVKRSSNGIYSIDGSGDWLDVQGVTVGANAGVRVIRYAAINPPAGVDPEMASALSGRSFAVSNARVTVATPVTLDAVVDATRHLDPAVVEAWLVQRGERFSVDSKQLVALADAKVPDRVIDVMVALSYPNVFAINPATRDAGFREPVQRVAGAGYDERASQNVYVDWGPWGRFGYGYYSPFGYSRYGYGPFGYGPYGYGPYGYGYGWHDGTVVIVRPSQSEPQPRGRAVNGRGYTRGGSSATTQTSDEPRRTAGSSGSSGSSGSRGSSSSGSGSSSRGSSSSGSSSSGSSSSGGEHRTAKPKP